MFNVELGFGEDDEVVLECLIMLFLSTVRTALINMYTNTIN